MNIDEKYKSINESLIQLRTKRSALKLKNEYLFDQMISTNDIIDEKNSKIKNSVLKSVYLYSIYFIVVSTLLNSYNIHLYPVALTSIYVVPLSASIFFPVHCKNKIEKKYDKKIKDAEDYNDNYEKEILLNNNEIYNINCEIEDLIVEEQVLDNIYNELYNEKNSNNMVSNDNVMKLVRTKRVSNLT